MREPSDRGRPASWSKQGPNFVPRSTALSVRPRDVNWTQIGTPRISGGSGHQQPWRWRAGLIPCWDNRGILVRVLVRSRGRGETPGTGPGRS